MVMKQGNCEGSTHEKFLFCYHGEGEQDTLPLENFEERFRAPQEGKKSNNSIKNKTFEEIKP